ncbi:MAG: sulfatase [Acidobacteriota bacterium]
MKFSAKFPRRLWWLLPFALVAVVGWGVACSPSVPRYSFPTPPILIFDIDTLRADHLGCYGYERDTSPHIDRFSAEAALFEWVFSQGPNTPPSQASILTALYPTSHGRIDHDDALPEEAETLAELLTDAGYRSAALVDGGLMAAGFGMEQGFESYDDEAGGLEKIGPKMLDWLDAHLTDPERQDEPFFLFVHTYDVHSPYEVTPWRFRQRYVDEVEEKPSEEYRGNMSKFMADTWNARYQPEAPQLSEAELDWAIAMYDGGIRHVDDWFSRLRQSLEAHGVWDEMIIAIISDHGDTFQEHDTLFHEQIYTPVARIPMLIRFPEGRHAGVYSDVVESIDLMPTLLDAVGVSAPAKIHGQNLRPVMEGEAGDGIAITESPYRGRRLAAANRRVRLLHTKKTGESELFRYRDDPLEMRDVIWEYPQESARLLDALERWEQRVNAYQFPKRSSEPLDAETIEQLKTLGYID